MIKEVERVPYEDYDHCPARNEIDNLKRWQQTQNGALLRMATSMESIDKRLDEVCNEASYRKGGEHMLKWIIGLVGFSGVASIVSIVVGLL